MQKTNQYPMLFVVKQYICSLKIFFLDRVFSFMYKFAREFRQESGQFRQQEQLNICYMASNTELFIAGIGASAGGLDAIQQLFNSIPGDTGLAFVIVQHLSPDFKSLMPELLAKHTSMRIYTATDNQFIEPNCIYLNQGNKNLSVVGRQLRLLEKGDKKDLNLPIDIFFRSLGTEHKEHSIGIILSGTGSDGSNGLKTIKEAGGSVIVQEPGTAQFDGMLNSAIHTNLVDFVLPPKGIAEMLVKISGQRLALKEPGLQGMSGDAAFYSILEEMYKYSGIDFREYKKNTLLRRLENRINVHNMEEISDYLVLLQSNKKEKEILKHDFLIGVTSFFRDVEAFQVIKENVVPSICRNHKSEEPIRIWISGCSTGEEAVSIAILFDEYIRHNKLPLDYKIFATDVHPKSLSIASAGIYNAGAETEIISGYIDDYFIRVGDKIQIIKRMREKIVYSRHNLLKDPPFIRIDLVSCRNLLIYLGSKIQKKILTNFLFALNHSGFLMLGSSESLGEIGQSFKVVDSKWKIYQNTSETKNLLIQMSPEERISSPSYKNPVADLSLQDYRFRESPELIYYKYLSKKYSPPAIFIDKDYNILFTTGDAGKHLTISEGAFNNNLLKAVRPELVPVIRNGVRRAEATDKDIIVKEIVGKHPTGNVLFDLQFQKLDTGEQAGASYCIIFSEDIPLDGENAVVIKNNLVDESTKIRLEDLESELKSTRYELQNAIEELETSNEEMQSSNEELMASNEELQSTNEELQSVNEELYTVNSELQEKNRELQILNDDMNNLLNSTDIGTLFLDNELKIRKFTPALKILFNLQESDLGRPISSFTSGFDDEVRLSIIRDSEKVLDKLVTVENEIQDKAGNHFLERINPYISSEKKIEGVVITFVDTGNMKKIEGDLVISENKFRNMFEHSPIGKYVMHLDGTLLVNSFFCEMLGYKKEEIGSWVDITYPDDIEISQKQIKDLLEGNAPASYKKRFVRKNGDILWGEVWSVAQRDDKGEPLYCLSSVVDITERLRIEEEVNLARQEAEIANMQKNYFLANMSHEIRTPMNSVVGFSELLKDANLSHSDINQYVNIINDNANHLLSLINDIIDVAKIEADELKINKEECLIYDLLTNLKINFENYKLSKNKGDIELKMVIPDGYQDLVLQTDKERLRQVISNLLNNAMKFSETPSTISFGFTAGKAALEFFVRDEGIGIPKGKTEEIFERFTQVNYNKNTLYGGTGLGLTICKGIITSLGGRIWAESEGEGKGSTFRFTIPVDKLVSAHVTDTAENFDSYNSLFEGKKILVVDDDPSIQMYFKKIFDKTRAVTYYAWSGKDALRLYHEIPDLDVVLMDIQMPEMNGMDALQEILKINPDARVIAQTAYALQEEKIKYLRAGFISYLGKPIRRETLFREMSRFL